MVATEGESFKSQPTHQDFTRSSSDAISGSKSHSRVPSGRKRSRALENQRNDETHSGPPPRVRLVYTHTHKHRHEHQPLNESLDDIRQP